MPRLFTKLRRQSGGLSKICFTSLTSTHVSRGSFWTRQLSQAVAGARFATMLDSLSRLCNRTCTYVQPTSSARQTSQHQRWSNVPPRFGIKFYHLYATMAGSRRSFYRRFQRAYGTHPRALDSNLQPAGMEAQSSASCMPWNGFLLTNASCSIFSSPQRH